MAAVPWATLSPLAAPIDNWFFPVYPCPMSNSQLESLVSRREVTAIRDALISRNGAIYIVGGTVRDSLLGNPVKEVDLTTNLAADVVESALSTAGIPNYRINREHHTVLVPGNEVALPLEITSFRSNSSALGTSIEEDLGLRDFTVNALAFTVNDRKLIDPLHGGEDLRNKILRAVGPDSSQRFKEDPLRILRLIRLSVQLGFTIEESTYIDARSNLFLLSKVSVERIRAEFDKVLLSSEVRRGFNLLYDVGFLHMFAPEIADAYGVPQNRFHSEDVFQHTLSVIELSEPDLLLRLSALVHDLGKPGTVSIDELTGDRHFFKHELLSAELGRRLMTRLKYSNQEIENVGTLAELHMRPVTAGAAGLRRLLRDTGKLYPIWRKLKEADSRACKRPADEISAELGEFDSKIAEILAGPQVMPLSSLAVNGNDLKETLGIPESPIIGVILRALHEEVLDVPERNDRNFLLSRAREFRDRSQVG